MYRFESVKKRRTFGFLFSLLLLLVLVAFKGIYAEEGDPCKTPLQESGTCIGIKSCEPLLQLLINKGATAEVTTLLRRSSCGWEGNFPLVCCPTETNKATERIEASSSSGLPDILPSPKNIVPSTLPRSPLCGRNNSTRPRIVNGEPASLGEYPWIVALGYRNPRNPDVPKWLCGGTLITGKHILTAAHCVYNRPDLYLARLGELDLYSDNDGAQPSTVDLVNAKIHEQFSPTTYTNDIAILTLARENDNPTVKPVCLPLDEPIRSNNFVRYNALVAGWGALYFNGPTSANLQTTMVPVVTNEQCSRAFINFHKTIIDQRVLCAGYTTGGKDACQGDSGGPLMYAKVESKNATFYQIGVVSYGFRCAEAGYPGVYTRVTSFIDWIEQNIN